MRSLSALLAILVACVTGVSAAQQPVVEILRDGKKFTVKAWVDIERSVEHTWPYIWEFKYVHRYVDNVKEVDSLRGGEGWYELTYKGDFPFLHLENTYHKWVIEKGKKIGNKSVNCAVNSPFPLGLKYAEGFWLLERLSAGRCRLYFEQELEVEAAGLEVLYTGIARNDGRRILSNFKRLAEGG